MEEELASLNLLEDEEEAFCEEAMAVDNEFQYCLVGRCLTNSVVHFPSLQNTMANLWHPIGGINIANMGDKSYLFQFFNDVDKNGVLSGAPWFLIITF